MTPERLLAKAGQALDDARFNLKAERLATAANRANYSMFYAAEAALLARGIRAKTHGQVASRFGLEFVKTGLFPIEMRRALNESGDLRLAADCPEEAVDAEDVTAAVNAARFLSAVRIFLDGWDTAAP